MKCPTCDYNEGSPEFVSYGYEFCCRSCRIEFNMAMECDVIRIEYDWNKPLPGGGFTKIGLTKSPNWRGTMASFYGEIESGQNTLAMDDATPVERINHLESLYDCDLELS